MEIKERSLLYLNNANDIVSLNNVQEMVELVLYRTYGICI
jgi:hypothetical protein